MLAFLWGGVGGLAPVGVAHHFPGAEAAGATFWHLVSTVVVPTSVVAVAVAFAFLSTSSARARKVNARGHEPPALAYLLADRPEEPEASGGGQSREGSAVRAVDRFYRVAFGDERGFRMWTERVVEFTSALQNFVPELLEMRPVIFVPLRPVPGEPLYAYVSAGARGLAAHISGGATVDPTPVAAAELPPGLTMLWGEGVDAAAYERRHA